MSDLAGETDADREVVSVALVNDKPLVVAGLARMIRDHASHLRITDVELGGSDLDPVDIALFDLADGECIEQRIEDLRVDRDVTHVAIYTWHADDDVLRVVAADPCISVIPKSLSGADLVDELTRIASKRPRREPPKRTALELPLGAAEPPQLPLDLSKRERDVVIGAASGLTNRALAARSGLSENTIKTYLTRAMQKTGSRNRAALAAWAAHHGLVRFE
ncbi:MAG: response regulator transcription factor [Acidimicrobiales bacterium]|nr:response regulator transcription factor [Acidimicrobiales bacterium]